MTHEHRNSNVFRDDIPLIWEGKKVVINGFTGPSSDSDPESFDLISGLQLFLNIREGSFVIKGNNKTIFRPHPEVIKKILDVTDRTPAATLRAQGILVQIDDLPQQIIDAIVDELDILKPQIYPTN